MKKTIKSLVIAASVAAIAGIGAVSFAAWEAGDVSDATGSGTTGSITTTAGTLAFAPENAEKALVPYNQEFGYLEASMALMHTYTVTYTGGAPASTYTFSMELTDGEDLPLYYQIGASVSTPTGTGTPSGWTAFTGSVELAALASSGTVTINIILVSDAKGAAAVAEMNQDYEITVSAELAD
ncbi:MAG: hypothetical protein J1F71_00465 [Clostridiales bacterium]|nr:hypothetical protein [Clostridiales bacterium]